MRLKSGMKNSIDYSFDMSKIVIEYVYWYDCCISTQLSVSWGLMCQCLLGTTSPEFMEIKRFDDYLQWLLNHHFSEENIILPSTLTVVS